MALPELDDVYRDAILDHSRDPRNRDPIPDPDLTADGVNPFCGDEVHLQVALDEQGRVQRAGLQGVGCAINQAAGSILTEVINGKTIEEIEALSDAFSGLMGGAGRTGEHPTVPKELAVLFGVRRFPVRVKCALLAWSALRDGIAEYRRAKRT